MYLLLWHGRPFTVTVNLLLWHGSPFTVTVSLLLWHGNSFTVTVSLLLWHDKPLKVPDGPITLPLTAKKPKPPGFWFLPSQSLYYLVDRCATCYTVYLPCRIARFAAC